MQNHRKVYVVDDERFIRRSLERLLRSADYDVLSFESPRTFIAAAPVLDFGCVLLDLKMPEMTGLEVQEQLNAGRVSLPVVMMSGHGDVCVAVKAMKAGAADFIEKPFEEDELFTAVCTALTHRAPRHLHGEAEDAAERVTSLTPREHQVLSALASGSTTKMIAFELGISIRTVEAHRARMMERLGARRLAEAIRYSFLASLA
jgi:two-component system, LuxR family, response regulator FixJ